MSSSFPEYKKTLPDFKPMGIMDFKELLFHYSETIVKLCFNFIHFFVYKLCKVFPGSYLLLR